MTKLTILTNLIAYFANLVKFAKHFFQSFLDHFGLFGLTIRFKTLVIAYILLNHSLFILGPLCLYSWMDLCVISSF